MVRECNAKSGGEVTYDLILKGGRVIDPSQGIDGVTDVAFSARQGRGDRRRI